MKIAVGQGSCGIAAGAGKAYDILNSKLDLANNQLTVTGCIGMCYLEPIVDVYADDGLHRFVKVNSDVAEEIATAINDNNLSSVAEFEISNDDKQFLDKQTRIALRHCGVINPEIIEDYTNDDGYKALNKVLTSMSPEDVIEEIKVSGLAGRGGAGFPTYVKFATDKKIDTLVINGAECEPYITSDSITMVDKAEDILLAIETGMSLPQISGNEYLKNIDLKQIVNLVEQGVIGELISIESSEGDIISIIVE